MLNKPTPARDERLGLRLPAISPAATTVRARVQWLAAQSAAAHL
jgi:hypothetical protein